MEQRRALGQHFLYANLVNAQSKQEVLESIAEALRAIRPMPAAFDREYVKRIDADNTMHTINKRSMLNAIREDINRFRDEKKVDRVVMLWCASTEIFIEPGPAHANLEAFEAAVAGGVPIIKALREGLTANRIEWIAGIINGTTNFILSEMREKRIDFASALAEAQRLGYAEADPTFDIGGFDTAHKLAILTSLAFGVAVDAEAIHVEGIQSITLADLKQTPEVAENIKTVYLPLVIVIVVVPEASAVPGGKRLRNRGGSICHRADARQERRVMQTSFVPCAERSAVKAVKGRNDCRAGRD